jgi:cysteine desulfurase/selenocysteine lyase
MNVGKIRKDFPILDDGLIYMDSAATSLTPEPVLNEILGYYRRYNANVERGVYRLSQIASQRYEEAHRKVANFIGAKEDEIVFTKNTTEGINQVASGLEWKRGEKVVTSLVEHHSNFMPWLRVKERYGIDLEIIKPKGNVLDSEDFEGAIDERTKLVAITHASSVLGSISPIEEIAKVCEDKGALLLVDGAQSVPHLPIDVRDIRCDFLAFSGHKMLGPTGIGVLFARSFDELEPLSIGGGTIDDVSLKDYKLRGGYERFEAGTPDIAGGIGLGSAVDYLEGVGMEEMRRYEERLQGKLIDGLRGIEKVKVYCPSDVKRMIGVVSFNVGGLNPHNLALMLDEAADITVRSGHHCCLPLMKELRLNGTVRASLYLYNTEEEVEKLLEMVEEIARVS